MAYQSAFKILFVAGLLSIGDLVSAQTTQVKPTGAKPWRPILESDIVKDVHILEEIDITQNEDLFGKKNTGNDLMNVLIAGEANGKLSVFSAADNGKLLHKLSHEDFLAQCAKAKNSLVTKYVLKEDSLFLNSADVVLRIKALAPVASIKPAIGSTVVAPLFWVYYFDARDHFSGYPASAALSWDDVLVDRHFTGTVTKRSVSEFHNGVYGRANKKVAPVK